MTLGLLGLEQGAAGKVLFASRLNEISTKIAICHKTRPSRALRVPLAISASVLTY